MSENELDLDTTPAREWTLIITAIDLARDQNHITWLTSNGKRVAAIVPAGTVTTKKALNQQPEGIPVNVFAPDCSIPMLSGTLIPGAPWAFWNRVIPDGEFIDLPPMYRIKKI